MQKNFPSVARLTREFRDVDEQDAKEIRRLMREALEGSRGFYHAKRQAHEALEAINKILRTAGVEYIYQGGVDVSYCNTGDTYAMTVVFDNITKKFRLSSYFNEAMRCRKQDEDYM